MSETRESYNATMLPGPELDILVALAMGKLNVLSYSTDSRFAMQAWEWLQNNHPWSEEGVFLGRETNAWEDIIKQPAVFRYVGYEELGTVCVGQTDCHAIALAVVEAGRVMGVIE